MESDSTTIESPESIHHDVVDDKQVDDTSLDAWRNWLQGELEQSAAYSEHGRLLDECCAIAASWRVRFWERRALWGRIRRGSRLVKELVEAAPVLARAKAQVERLQLKEGQPRLVVLDLCSGFGYLGMFLSELLHAVAHKVRLPFPKPKPIHQEPKPI